MHLTRAFMHARVYPASRLCIRVYPGPTGGQPAASEYWNGNDANEKHLSHASRISFPSRSPSERTDFSWKLTSRYADSHPYNNEATEARRSVS